MFSFPTWTYPDGTRSVNRPKDGQIFNVQDPSDPNKTITWQWDDVLVTWSNVSSGKYNQHNTATFAFPSITFDLKDLKPWTQINFEPKCECGSEAVGSPKHSHWCDKFDPLT